MSELIYDALMLGRNKKVAREEYLVARGEKEAAAFTVQEENIEFADVMEEQSGVLHLTLSHPGYLEIEAYCADAFVQLEKKVITTDDFVDGTCEFAYKILPGKLHNGKNFARISFLTPTCTISVNILVNNKIRTFLGGTGQKRIIAELVRNYLDLRMGNLFQEEWLEKTDRLLSDVNGTDEVDLFLLLYKANALITGDRFEEAKNLLEFVQQQLWKMKDADHPLACYFAYVRSLYEMNDERTGIEAAKIGRIYKERPSWRLLWVLFYMDSSYDEHPERKADMIESEFTKRHCSSPVMYFEALECFKSRPWLIARASDFELQTLYFGARHDFLNLNSAMRIAEILLDMSDAELTRCNVPMAIRVLKILCAKFDSGMILKALCRLLIYSDTRRTEDHAYFVRAINEFIELPGIYNQFVYTADRLKFEDMPEDVLRYFMGHEETLGPYREYYLACIVDHKIKHPNYYKSYQGRNLRLASEQIAAGRSSEALAIIYKDIFEEGNITARLSQRLFEVLCIRKVTPHSRRIVSVLVFHKELTEYQEAYLEDGSANVKIYSPDAILLFKDEAGNLYANIEYDMKELIRSREYVGICIQNAPISRYMLIGDNLFLLRSYKDPSEILEYLFNNMGSGQLRSEYEQQILKEMIVYFSKNTKDEAVYDRLLYFLDFDLDKETRGKLIEVMIERKLFKEAYEQIEQNGVDGISPERVTQLAHVLVELQDYEEDDLLTKLCRVSFMKSGFDPEIFHYLSLHYDDRLEVLLDMYTAAHAYDLDSAQIAERIVRKSLADPSRQGDVALVFADYYEKGNDADLKKAYITNMAERYIYEGDRKAASCFPFMEKELKEGTAFSDCAKAAFLLYMRLKDDMEQPTRKVVEEVLKDLVRRSIMLEEFKDLRKFFAIPAPLSNCAVAEIFYPDRARAEQSEKTEPLPAEAWESEIGSTARIQDLQDGSAPITRENMFRGVPVISFTMRKDSGEVHSEEAMNEVFPGCYTKHFTLFHAERVRYSIDGGPQITVDYSDLHIVKDVSRYSALDEMISLMHTGSEEDLAKAVREYYIKDSLIDRLF